MSLRETLIKCADVVACPAILVVEALKALGKVALGSVEGFVNLPKEVRSAVINGMKTGIKNRFKASNDELKLSAQAAMNIRQMVDDEKKALADALLSEGKEKLALIGDKISPVTGGYIRNALEFYYTPKADKEKVARQLLAECELEKSQKLSNTAVLAALNNNQK